MTNIAMERSTIFKNGKPSISIRAMASSSFFVRSPGQVNHAAQQRPGVEVGARGTL